MSSPVPTCGSGPPRSPQSATFGTRPVGRAPPVWPTSLPTSCWRCRHCTGWTRRRRSPRSPAFCGRVASSRRLDCDWPPSVGNADAEQAWHTARGNRCRRTTARSLGDAGVARGRRRRHRRPTTCDRSTPAIEPAAVTIADGVQFWHKDEHLGRMVASGQFQHCVEVAALGEERGDADRFVQLFCSQGDYQSLRRRGFDDSTLGYRHVRCRSAIERSVTSNARSGSPTAPASACAARSFQPCAWSSLVARSTTPVG